MFHILHTHTQAHLFKYIELNLVVGFYVKVIEKAGESTAAAAAAGSTNNNNNNYSDFL